MFCYRHPDNSKLILENINFKLNKSEIVAFVGKTGSGKTTLMNLIPRLIDPTQGVIEINGIDIQNYYVKNLRDKIGFVSQKIFYLKVLFLVICYLVKKMLIVKKCSKSLK